MMLEEKFGSVEDAKPETRSHGNTSEFLLRVVLNMFSLFPVLLLALSAQASILTLKSPRFTVIDATGSQIRSEPCVILPLLVDSQNSFDQSRIEYLPDTNHLHP